MPLAARVMLTQNERRPPLGPRRPGARVLATASCVSLSRSMKTSPRSSVLIDLAAIRSNVAHLLVPSPSGHPHARRGQGRRLRSRHAPGGPGGGGGGSAWGGRRDRGGSASRCATPASTAWSWSWARSTALDQYEEMAHRRVDFAVVSDHMAESCPNCKGSGPAGARAPQDRQRDEPPGPVPIGGRRFPRVHPRHPRDRARRRHDPLRLRHRGSSHHRHCSWSGSSRRWSRCAANGRGPLLTPLTAPRRSTPPTPTWTWCAAAARSTGSPPGSRTPLAEGLQPALSWKSQVVLVKRVERRRGRRLRPHLPGRDIPPM